MTVSVGAMLHLSSHRFFYQTIENAAILFFILTLLIYIYEVGNFLILWYFEIFFKLLSLSSTTTQMSNNSLVLYNFIQVIKYFSNVNLQAALNFRSIKANTGNIHLFCIWFKSIILSFGVKKHLSQSMSRDITTRVE